jgi:hypothetical protein
MKTIDNYITERLNPRHLGDTIDLKIGNVNNVPGLIRWKLGWRDFAGSSWSAAVMMTDKWSNPLLIFWSPDSTYIPYRTTRKKGDAWHLMQTKSETAPYGQKGYEYLYNIFTNKDVGEKITIWGGTESSDSDIPDQVKDIVKEFYKKIL